MQIYNETLNTFSAQKSHCYLSANMRKLKLTTTLMRCWKVNSNETITTISHLWGYSTWL